MDSNRYQAERQKSGRRGRPKIIISRDQLLMFHELGYTSHQMAEHFKCSPKLVYKRLYEENIHQRDRYNNLTDGELDIKVQEILDNHPNAGSVMMYGFLDSMNVKVQRARVRSSLARVTSAVGVKRGQAVKRRQYSVPSSNFLWHMDGHMKLIRWGIATHGAIDGYSRLIVYLVSSDNNRALTVLGNFVPACLRYGIPSKVRSDHGGENILVGLFMNLVNKEETSSIITGKSVHNQRIERLWRDVFQQVVEQFYKLFYSFEDEGILNLNSSLHLFCLRYVFIPIINKNLKSFMFAWNKHKLRTEGNRSPEMLWLDGVLSNIRSTSLAMQNLFDSDPLEVSLRQALQEFDLNLDNFQENAETEVAAVSEEQAAEITAMSSQYSDYKLKFSNCLALMERMNIQVQ